MFEVMKEIGKLQSEYQKLVKENKLSKKAMCDLVIPFRDKYHLTDVEALQIARNELSIMQIVMLLEKETAEE